MKLRKVLAAVLATSLIAAGLTACGGSDSAASSAASTAASAVEEVKEEATAAASEVKEEATEAVEEVKEEVTETVEEVKEEVTDTAAAAADALTYVDLAGQDIVIGVATGSSGTSWRDQSMRQLSAVFDEYVADGTIKSYKLVNNTTNGDANEQATIIRNFIDDPEVNVIMLNPNDATALNEAIEDAIAAGKLVISFDATVTAKGVLNVTNDHYNYAYLPTKELLDLAGGKGTAVEISGLDGHPADVLRIEGTDAALAEYPDVQLLANQPGGWDNTTAKQVMASFLSAGMTPDIIITQDSEAFGILQACQDADFLPKAMNGDGTKAFFEEWKKLRDEGADFEVVVAPNPPAISATAGRIAVSLAQGKHFKDGVLTDGNIYMYQIAQTYTNANFDEAWEVVQNLSAEECLDEYLSQEECDALFE